MKKLVLTGGPCAGKTTAKNRILQKLAEWGFPAIFVPEVATQIIEAGLDPRKLNKRQKRAFETLIIKTQMRDEDEKYGVALTIKGGRGPVMLCDRGCMDVAAYVNQQEFSSILRENRWDRVMLRDKRYDAVFHLVTAADGKAKFYNLDNPARHETPAQARQLDRRVREAWLGHPHLMVVDNSTLFEEKIRRLIAKIQRVLGIPVSLEIEKKFLVKGIDLDRIPVPFQKIEIEQIYLHDEKGEFRVRRRSQENASAVYYETRKKKTGSVFTRIETENKISRSEYYERLRNVDPSLEPIHKTRVCFLWENQYFELDIFNEPERLRGLTLLEIELTEENDKVSLPGWLGNAKLVSNDKQYSNKSLARRG